MSVILASQTFLGQPARPQPRGSPISSTPSVEPTPPPPVEPAVDLTLPIEWPASVVYGEGSIWLAASANDGTGGGTIYRIDADTAGILAEIPVASIPTWVTGGGAMEVSDGSLWVVGGGGRTGLVRIDTSTNAVTGEFPVGGAFPADLAIDEHGVWVSVFVRDKGDPPQERMHLVRFDPVTGTEEARILLESEYAREVLAIDGTIWVHERRTHGPVVGSSLLTRIDPETERVVASVPLGSSSTSVTEGDGFIWATTWTSEEGNVLGRLDPRTNELVRIPSQTLEFVIDVGEGGIWGVARDGPNLFGKRTGVARFEPVTGRVDATSGALGGGPIALAVAPGSVWVAHYEEGITRVELSPG